MKYSLRDNLLKNAFLRRVATLVGGTAIGQVITILALPLLTRLYEPEVFSILAVYVATISLITVVACMRLEIAIPLPKSERIAAAVCVLAVISVMIFTLLSVLSVLAVMFTPDFFNFITEGKLSQFLWLIPLGVFAVGMYNALQYWSTRNKKFGLIAKTRMTQSLTGTFVKLGTGFLTSGWAAGLILGQVLSQGAGSLSLGASLIKNDWRSFQGIKLKHLSFALKRYDKFPKYSTLEAFLNTGGIQIPIILIAYYASGPEAGHLMIAMQLLLAPMGLIGHAVAQVYLSEGAEFYRKGELKDFTYKTIGNLAKLAILPLMFVAATSPFIIPYLLGGQWQRAGVLMSWMAPWFFIQFITSPISMSLHITGNQKAAFLLQLVGFIIRVGAVLLAATYSVSFVGEIYAVSGFVFYCIYLLFVISVLKKFSKGKAA